MIINLKKDWFILSLLSFLLFLYLILTSAFSGYGFFIDELYFIACSKRLAFGYIDQPPLSILALSFSRLIFGESIVAVRIFAALAVSYNVFITGVIARKLGGNRNAMIMAGIAVMVFPVNLLFGSFYSMNAFELPIWSTVIFYAIKIVKEENQKYWLHIGILMGIGLEMKHTIVVYCLMMVIALFLTKNRKFLFSKWTVFGFVACFLLILPNLIWQYLNNFPSLELYKNSFGKNLSLPPLEVLKNQVVFVNPFSLPLWLTGLFFLSITELRKYLFLSITYVLLLLLMIFTGSSRPDRIAAIYPLLFAAGSVVITSLKKEVLRFVPHLVITLMIIGGLLAAPIFTPLVSPFYTSKYISKIGLKFDIESGKINESLPQWLADRLGWVELASVTGEVYHSLPAEEQKNTVILSTNYGEAGALEVYGPKFGLPKVYATHNSFHSWGPPPDSVRTYIIVFANENDVFKYFDSVTVASNATCEFCTKPQRSIPVYIARGPKFIMSESWSRFKIWM